MTIHLLFYVIEEYGDTDPPEPWGYYEHPSVEVPKIGDVIMLKTLDGRNHHRVKVVSVDGSELRTEPVKPKRCQRCDVVLIEGPTSLDDERYERGVCGGCA